MIGWCGNGGGLQSLQTLGEESSPVERVLEENKSSGRRNPRRSKAATTDAVAEKMQPVEQEPMVTTETQAPMVTVLHQATQETMATLATQAITVTEPTAAQQETQAIMVAQAIPALQVTQAPMEIPEATGMQARQQPSATTQTSQADQQELVVLEEMVVRRGQEVTAATAEPRAMPETPETPETTVFAAMEATQATLAIRATLETMVFAETVAHEEMQATPAMPGHLVIRGTMELGVIAAMVVAVAEAVTAVVLDLSAI